MRIGSRRWLQYIGESLGILRDVYHPDRNVTDRTDVVPASPELQALADDRAAILGIRSVDLLVWEHPFINALPLGDRTGGTLVVSTRFVDFFEPSALDAALTHELGHIRAEHGGRYFRWIVVGLFVWCWVVLLHRSRLTTSGMAGVVLLALLAIARRYEREADEHAMLVLDDPAQLAQAIAAVRSGDPTIDVHTFRPSSSSRLRALFSVYPDPSRRFPDVFSPAK